MSEMMTKYIKLFEMEASVTIEALIGEKPNVSFKSDEKVCVVSTSSDKGSVIFEIKFNDEISHMMVSAPDPIIKYLSNSMMGVDTTTDDLVSLDEDDYDALREVLVNIIGSMHNEIATRKDLPYLSSSEQWYSDIEFSNVWKFEFEFDHNVSGIIKCYTTNNFPINNNIKIKDGQMVDDMVGFNRIKDVQIPIKVRLGRKEITLKEASELGVNSVIELDQLSNDPIDIVVNNIVIATGEVVLVDGNYGVQITHIFKEGRKDTYV